VIPRVDVHTGTLFAFGVGPGDLKAMKYRELEYFHDKAEEITKARANAMKGR